MVMRYPDLCDDFGDTQEMDYIIDEIEIWTVRLYDRDGMGKMVGDISLHDDGNTLNDGNSIVLDMVPLSGYSTFVKHARERSEKKEF